MGSEMCIRDSIGADDFLDGIRWYRRLLDGLDSTTAAAEVGR